MTRNQLVALAMDVVERRGTLDDGIRTLLDATAGHASLLTGAEQLLRHQLVDGADTTRRREALLLLGWTIRVAGTAAGNPDPFRKGTEGPGQRSSRVGSFERA